MTRMQKKYYDLTRPLSILDLLVGTLSFVQRIRSVYNRISHLQVQLHLTRQYSLSGDTRRVYVRSAPNGEPGPKIVKKKWGTGFDGSDLITDVRVRRRQFVPFGLYCNTCDTLMQNERYRALEVEERKIKVFLSSPDEIVQGYVL